MRRLLVRFVALAVLLVACGAAAAADTNPLDRPLPPGFKAKRAGSELSLGLPRRWAALDQRAAVFPGVAQTLGRTNRGLVPYLAALGVPDSPLRLLAFDPAVRGGWATATVLASSLPLRGAPYALWSRPVIRAIRALPSRRGRLSVRHVLLGAGEAVRLAYVRKAGSRSFATVQFAVAAGSKLYTLTYAVPQAVARNYRGVFDASARTFAVAGR